MPSLVRVTLANLCSFGRVYLPSSALPRGWIKRPTAALGCRQGLGVLLAGSGLPTLISRVCSKEHLSSFRANLHTACWCRSLCTALPQTKHWCLQINVKWYHRIFCFIILPVTMKVRLFLPDPSWVTVICYGMGQEEMRYGLGLIVFCGTNKCVSELSMTALQWVNIFLLVQLLANAVIFLCGNFMGAFHKRQMQVASWDLYRYTLKCIQVRMKLKIEKRQQVSRLVHVINCLFSFPKSV